MYPFRSPSLIARELHHRGVVASPSTVRRDLIHMGFSPHALRTAPPLNDEHKRLRVAFCKAMIQRSDSIMFSDEKQFDSNQTQKLWQWRRPEQPEEMRTVEQGAPSVTAWACIGVGFKRLMLFPKTIITKDVYQNQILSPSVPALKAYQRENGNSVFQQDNARPHCGGLEFLRRRQVRTLDVAWPALSCDLSPVEQLWQWIDADVKARGPWGEQELSSFIQKSFDDVPQERIDRLVQTFKLRCEKVIASNGNTIKP
jgi:transposase